MEHYFQQPVIRSESSREDIDRWRCLSDGSENNSAGGFDCNICLDLVEDPVVTFCGHLYCWACFYRWIHSHEDSYENQPQCPVCKAEVSEDTVIPLYGRGQNGKSSDGKGSQHGPPVVPQRPNGPRYGFHTLITTPSSSSHPSHLRHHDGFHHHRNIHPYYPNFPAFGFAGTTTFHPMIGMFGEMLCARIFGNSQTTLYAYPNTYSVVTTGSARARRHVMEVDKSLSRISFFLCCCLILCLLSF